MVEFLNGRQSSSLSETDNVDIKYQLFYSPQEILLKTRNVSYATTFSVRNILIEKAFLGIKCSAGTYFIP